MDGFNVYHSLGAAEREVEKLDRFNILNGKPRLAFNGRNFRWFNIPAALESLARAISKEARIVETIYFSAYAHHAGRDGVERHRLYVSALEGLGVRCVMSGFKDKEIVCRACRVSFTRKEEKETDVAIAAAMFEASQRADIDAYLLFSGDTDQLPAIRLVKRLSPAKPLFILFPFQRANKDLEKESQRSWAVDLKSLDRWRWPKSLILPSGTEIVRPDKYDG